MFEQRQRSFSSDCYYEEKGFIEYCANPAYTTKPSLPIQPVQPIEQPSTGFAVGCPIQ
jgi:hypothetical protein